MNYSPLPNCTFFVFPLLAAYISILLFARAAGGPLTLRLVLVMFRLLLIGLSLYLHTCMKAFSHILVLYVPPVHRQVLSEKYKFLYRQQ